MSIDVSEPDLNPPEEEWFEEAERKDAKDARVAESLYEWMCETVRIHARMEVTSGR